MPLLAAVCAFTGTMLVATAAWRLALRQNHRDEGRRTRMAARIQTALDQPAWGAAEQADYDQVREWAAQPYDCDRGVVYAEFGRRSLTELALLPGEDAA